MRMTTSNIQDRATEPTRVLLAHPGSSEAGPLGRALEEEFEILVAAADSSHILHAVQAFEPAVVVLDVSRRAFDVVRVLREMRRARIDVGVVIVAADLPDEAVLQAVYLDVAGLVVCPPTAEAVIDCVRQVRAGFLCLDQQTLRRAVKTLGDRLATLREVAGVLTNRELEIVRLVGVGFTNKEIAARLFIEEGTIKVHLHNIFEKLHITDRKKLAAYARAKGLGPEDFPG